jgi:hypothetical protein
MVRGFDCRGGAEDFSDGLAESVAGAFRGVAQSDFELGRQPLDRVEVGEDCGRNSRVASAARIAGRLALSWWLPGVSTMKTPRGLQRRDRDPFST